MNHNALDAAKFFGAHNTPTHGHQLGNHSLASCAISAIFKTTFYRLQNISSFHLLGVIKRLDIYNMHTIIASKVCDFQ